MLQLVREFIEKKLKNNRANDEILLVKISESFKKVILLLEPLGVLENFL